MKDYTSIRLKIQTNGLAENISLITELIDSAGGPPAIVYAESLDSSSMVPPSAMAQPPRIAINRKEQTFRSLDDYLRSLQVSENLCNEIPFHIYFDLHKTVIQSINRGAGSITETSVPELPRDDKSFARTLYEHKFACLTLFMRGARPKHKAKEGATEEFPLHHNLDSWHGLFEWDDFSLLAKELCNFAEIFSVEITNKGFSIFAYYLRQSSLLQIDINEKENFSVLSKVLTAVWLIKQKSLFWRNSAETGEHPEFYEDAYQFLLNLVRHHESEA